MLGKYYQKNFGGYFLAAPCEYNNFYEVMARDSFAWRTKKSIKFVSDLYQIGGSAFVFFLSIFC